MTIAHLLVAFAFALLVVRDASADRMVRVLFNEGLDSATAGSCTATDDTKINSVIAASSSNSTYIKRSLRAGEWQYEERQLWPAKCRNNCLGYAPRTCRATDCVGYRRRELSSGKSFKCEDQVEFINHELNKLVNANLVSASCKELLMKPRKCDCYDDIIYGTVERMILWNVNPSRTIADDEFTGGDLCKNTMVDFEPVTNQCVDILETAITGPNGYSFQSQRNDDDDDESVNSLFGGDDDDEPGGTLFPSLGQYTMTSVPDGFTDKAHVIHFNVVTGSVEAVRAWNTTTKTIMNSNFTGGTICRNRPFNLEVIVGSCAASVRIKLTGPPGYTTTTVNDVKRPFSIFGDTSGVFIGKSLSTIGAYRLTISPDQLDPSPFVKIIDFNVTNCG